MKQSYLLVLNRNVMKSWTLIKSHTETLFYCKCTFVANLMVLLFYFNMKPPLLYFTRNNVLLYKKDGIVLAGFRSSY